MSIELASAARYAKQFYDLGMFFRTYIHNNINVDEAKDVCLDCSSLESLIFAFLSGKQA